MNAIATVARKELRALFYSPIALIFLGAFLLVTLFTFFTAERFFARNIADLRPLFDWLPVLLVFLVSAVTMRAWAEERKMGTLELLLTLPLSSRQLVLGKFLAATGLVACALALTLPLPLMVAGLGDLDWGPVIGGYVGALLLGAAYVAIGLAVSARSDNQIVALMTTLLVGGAVYLVGSHALVDLVGNRTGELLRALGTGARFESIARGVVDLRDVVYYAAIVVIGLTVNVAFLESGRLDRSSPAGRRALGAIAGGAALIVLNALFANLWLAPVSGARADLTKNGDYSLTDVTVGVLRSLDEPLTIEGYFSERSHPLLAPLVPQIRDLLQEYEVKGRGRVRLAFADPNADEDVEARVQEDYGIRATPFQVADRTQQAVVNAFFHIVVRYGDQYEVLDFGDLIEVHFDGDDLDVRLRNFEYDMTRAIRRVSQDFQTTESMLARLDEGATLTFYVTPDRVPDDLSPVIDHVRAVAEELSERSGRFGFVEVDPTGDRATQEDIARRYNVRPLAVDFFGDESFYLDLVLTSGDRVQRIVPRDVASEADVRVAVEAAIERITPGQLTTIGLVTRQPEPPRMDPNIPPQFQPPPEQPDYRLLEQVLSESNEVRRLQLDDGEVPADIDVLVVAKTDPLTDEARWAIDQFLMRGGAVIALAGRQAISASRDGLEARPTNEGLDELLEAWGVDVGAGFVADTQSATFPLPRQERRGNLIVQRVELLDYALFPDVRTDGFDRSHPALSGLPGVTLPWASPLEVDPPEGVEATVLLRTTDESWVVDGTGTDPDLDRYPEHGFEREATTAGSKVGAVALTGIFPSWFADRPSPFFAADEDAGDEEGDAQGRTLTESLPSARLAVVGSTELVSDLVMSLSQQPGGEVHRANTLLIENLVDWAMADTDLLEIRSGGSFARTLRPLSDGTRGRLEATQYAIALFAVIAIGAGATLRRRRAQPFTVENGS